MKLPDISLLHKDEREEILDLKLRGSPRRWSMEDKTPASMICATFLRFGLKAETKNSIEGALVSSHELIFESNVRLEKILGLHSEVARALGVEDVLIYRHPSRSSIMVEVPNKVRRKIYLRDILEDSSHYEHAGQVPIAIGQRPNGQGVTIDLAQSPHLLIGGCTGSGKSTVLHSIIVSLLLRFGHAQLQLVLVDPKRLEMNAYRGLPHLAHPVIDDPVIAVGALNALLNEIKLRTEILEKAGVQDIETLNKNKFQMTRVVFVIDELADLMFACGKQAEEPLARCAALGRAVGVHLIVATQRPEVKVVTGLIKANFPTRIGMRVVDKINSRIILDQSGAETLLGHGDSLMMSPASTKLERVHCAYVSREEINLIVNHYKEQERKVA